MERPSTTSGRLMFGTLGRAGRIGVIYALFGSLWIILSDRVLLWLVVDTHHYSWLQTWKGWFYVAITALLVTAMVRRDLQRQEKLLQRALEGEGRLRAIFDTVGDAIFVHDPETGEILDVSAGIRDWGYEPEELRGVGVARISANLPPWSENAALSWIQRAAAGEQPTFHWLARRKDGSVFWAEVNLRRVDLSGRPVVLALAQDVSERKVAEAALRASEERFSKAFHARGVAMSISDRQGRQLHVNDALCELLGRSRLEIMGRTTTEMGVLIPEEFQRLQGVLGSEHRLDGQELLLHRPDGGLRHALCTTESIELDGEPCWLSVMTDITALRVAEEARRLGDQRLRSVTENAPAFIAELDHEGRFIFLSRLQPGFRMEEVLGRPFDLWVPVEQRPILWQAFGEVVATGEPRDYELEGAGSPDSLVWYATRLAPVLEDGRVVRVVSISQDITARRRAEDALRESEARFRGLFEQASVGVVLFHALEQRLKWANPRFCELVGYSWAELERLDHQRLLVPEEKPALQESVERVLAGQASEITATLRLARKDGRLVWVEVTVSSLGVPDGEGGLHIAVVHDITSRRQAEQALRESEERYRLLFDANPHPMWVFDRDSLAFLAVNDAAVAAYGWSRNEFLGMRITDIRPPEDVSRLLESVARGSSGLDDAGVWRHLRKDGSLLLAEISSHPLEFALHRAVLVLALDVSGRIKAEQELRENEARLRLALAASRQGLFDLDLRSGEAVVTPEYAQMLGYEADDTHWTAERWRGLIHPEDRAEAERVLGEYPAGVRTDHRLVLRMRTREGAWKRILSLGRLMEHDEAGRPLRLLGTHTELGGPAKSGELEP